MLTGFVRLWPFFAHVMYLFNAPFILRFAIMMKGLSQPENDEITAIIPLVAHAAHMPEYFIGPVD